MKKLADYKSNKFSQYGEDGIIEKIFSIIGTESKVCVEFGAWDGFHLSNTALLWTTSWKGILIEGSSKRFNILLENTKKYDCVCIREFVGRQGKYSLEGIFQGYKLDNNVDLLSIDIDGDDYYIFESLEELRPRVVICEYNPTIPAEKDIFADYGSNFGSSVSAIDRVAREKGYMLVAITESNCIFVLSKYKDLFNEYETRIENLKHDEFEINVITSFTGEYVLANSREPIFGLTLPYRRNLNGKHLELGIPCGISKIYQYIKKLDRYIRRNILKK